MIELGKQNRAGRRRQLQSSVDTVQKVYAGINSRRKNESFPTNVSAHNCSGEQKCGFRGKNPNPVGARVAHVANTSGAEYGFQRLVNDHDGDHSER